MQAKHTPLPWRAEIEEKFGDEIEIVDEQGRTVCTVDYDDGYGQPDADLIVRAVNSHSDLLAELHDTALWLDQWANLMLALLADPTGWGRGAAVTEKREAIRTEAARHRGRAAVIRQTILKATQGV